jgi:type II secretory pathway component GspD/PulD (secretin)
MLPSDFLRSLRSILVTVALLLPVWLGAQNVTLNLKDVSVQEAVTQLQSQGNYTIVISADDVDLQRRVSVSAKDMPLTEVLSQIFKGQDLDFSIHGNTVSVTRHKTVASVPGKNSLRGVVLDRSGEPLIGASLVDKASGAYAISDENGAFTMTGITLPTVLTVSYLGFDDQEVSVTGKERQPITIMMENENSVLDELVVVGYGTQKRVNLTGAVSVID